MSSPQFPVNLRSIAWALLSQTIWIPLVALDAHDRWQANNYELDLERDFISSRSAFPDRRGLNSPDQQSGTDTKAKQSADPVRKPSSGLVVGRADSPLDPLLNRPIQRSLDVSSAPPSSSSAPLISTGNSAFFNPTLRPPSVNAVRRSSSLKPTRLSKPSTSKPSTPLMATFTGSDLLGGTLTLSDLDSPAMPPLARAERASWARSGDPMAPLPVIWRDPVRKALDTLPNPARYVAPARVVHVPSTRVTRSTSVPLAIQSDGSVDILSQPDSPEVVEEIESWSNRQSAPPQNTVAPAVVHLEPLPEDPKPLSMNTRTLSPPESQTSPPVPVQRPIQPLAETAPIQTSHHSAEEPRTSTAVTTPTPASTPLAPTAPTSDQQLP